MQISDNEKVNDSEIEIVTAFFDCGRGNYEVQKRTNDKYMEYFRFWARIQNHVVIYTTSEFADEISKIRKKYGLENKTSIIVVDDIYRIEPDIYEKMRKIEKRGVMKKWRYVQNDISNQAAYDYIMLMKYWFLSDCVKKGIVKQNSNIAWIDFGWNHGGEVYSIKEEFDFLWEYPFTNGIHLFSRSNPDTDNGFLKLQFMSDSLMGSQLVCSADKCELLYRYILEAMNSLLSIDIFDDDQMLLRMAYKTHKDNINIHICDWFMPLKLYGGEHLTVKGKEEVVKKAKSPYLNKIKMKVVDMIIEIVESEFLKRMRYLVNNN